MSAVTAKGQTPASNSPSDIATAINNISSGSTEYMSLGSPLIGSSNWNSVSNLIAFGKVPIYNTYTNTNPSGGFEIRSVYNDWVDESVTSTYSGQKCISWNLLKNKYSKICITVRADISVANNSNIQPTEATLMFTAYFPNSSIHIQSYAVSDITKNTSNNAMTRYSASSTWYSHVEITRETITSFVNSNSISNDMKFLHGIYTYFTFSNTITGSLIGYLMYNMYGKDD